ncbi:alpha/beta fold hydrolase [Oleiagrimonas sp. C23AA]|uniref:alpha/beta hydrolase family protein n=1 Tax=Oleiagrimonas sp. C23AA TaxID=2719047 RepID=UPI00142476AA|nr:alpha/beta fold hydrolase [Oleiagrimonas sp. C23AA]NII10203.1 alpha/beta fold hydrolase [Oleiagrimonas sp. C23AA]
MKRLAYLALGLLVSAPVLAAPPPCMQRSSALLQALKKHDYAGAVSHFDARVHAVVTVKRLRQVWETALPNQFGAYDPAAVGQVAKQGPDGVVVTPLHFKHGWLHMRVACDDAGAISGFRFLPGKSPAPDDVEHAPKPASGPWGSSQPTQVASPWGPLPALLTLPRGKGPFPAVVLVGGSGPHDRDERIGPNRPFMDIARGLAAHGIASLRYDKRTYVYPVKSEQDTRLTIDDEVTDDAVTALRQLAANEQVDRRRIFVVGHSLGAMMAPRIGQRMPGLAGLVLLAAPARSLLDVLAEQTRTLGPKQGLSSAQLKSAEAGIDHERRLLEKADPAHPPKKPFMGAPQSYWLSLDGYHQVAVARSLHMPLLIVQGGADVQVSPTQDFARWKTAMAGRAHVRFRRFDGLSHLFMPAGKTGNAADYMRPAHVAPGVIDAIADWIKTQPPAPKRAGRAL